MSEVSLSRYFDHNVTSPLRGAARQAWEDSSDRAWSNPSSPHAGGVRCRALLEDLRGHIASVMGGIPRRWAFTSGATEANNTIFAYFRQRLGSRGKVAISSVEHPSVTEAAKAWFGENVVELPVDREGKLLLDALSETLHEVKPDLVSVMAANNETGVVQPWAEVRAFCREARVPFHCDATQWIGRMPCEKLGSCDFLSGSFHKLGGPKGVGFLQTSEEEAASFLFGGEQENGMRAGTENVPAIHSSSVALEEASMKLVDGAIRDRFEDLLEQLVPGVQILGKGVERLPPLSTFLLPNFENLRWVNRLDRLGFAVSTGSACATGHEGSSHVLAAMGRGADEARRVIRVSGGWTNASEDWDALANAFGTVFRELLDQEGDSQTIAL